MDGAGKADHQSTGLVKMMVKASRVGEQDQRVGDQEQMMLGSRTGW